MNEDNLPDYEAVKACGESAIELWQNIGMREAFGPLSEGAVLLINSKDNTDLWKNLAVIYGHVCAFMSNVAVTGKHPSFTLAPELNTVPEPGLFHNYRDDLHKYYRDRVDLFILLQLLLYSGAVYLDKIAMDIALIILGMNKNSFNLCKIGNNIIPHLIAAEKYNEAINLSLNSNRYLFSLKVSENQKPETEEELSNILNREQDTFRQEIDRSTVFFSLMPIMLRLGNTCIFDPDRAGQKAIEVAAAYHDVAGSSSLPELWTSSGDMIKEIFNYSYSFQELLDLGDKFSQESNFAMKHICLLGATLQQDIIPENAIFTHIIIFQEMVRSFMSVPFLYRQTAVLFFKNYWKKKFDNNRFRFISPFFVESQLESAFKLPPDKIIQKILHIIVTSLNIKYDRDYINGLITD